MVSLLNFSGLLGVFVVSSVAGVIEISFVRDISILNAFWLALLLHASFTIKDDLASGYSPCMSGSARAGQCS